MIYIYTLTSAITPSQSGPGSNGNEGVLHVPPKHKDWRLAIRWLVSYLGHSLGGVLSHYINYSPRKLGYGKRPDIEEKGNQLVTERATSYYLNFEVERNRFPWLEAGLDLPKNRSFLDFKSSCFGDQTKIIYTFSHKASEMFP